jgi:predicted Zn-dependent protease
VPFHNAEWTGFYYDGRTANREIVTVTIGDGCLSLRRTDGSLIQWPLDALRQTQGVVGNEKLRLEFGTDPVEALLVHQSGLPEAIRAAAPKAIKRVRPRQNTAKVAGLSIAGLAAAALAYAFAAPIIADWLAPKVLVSWEQNLGRSVMERLAPPHRRCGHATAYADLGVIVDRLLAAAPSAPYAMHVSVVQDSAVNAFAAPGGFIVLHSGLLSSAETPEQVAGVLAHEIQHVLHRHSTRAVIREAPLRLAIATVSGSGIETAAAVIGTIGAMRHRRADEAEADRDGLRMLEAAQIDPAGLIAFLRRLEKDNARAPRVVSYLSSHPHTADRVAALEALGSRQRPRVRPVLDSAGWERVRRMCSS